MRVPLRIATCAVSGGFSHLYTALENKLFVKYGLRIEHVFIRGSMPALKALAAEEIHFLYCAGEVTLPALAGGIDAKLLAAPLVRPPHVLVTRRDIRRVEDLEGKTLGVGRAGDLSDRLSNTLVKKLKLAEVKIRPVGGSQVERYQYLTADAVQGLVITPPLDVRARKEGYPVVYRLADLDIPFVYSSLHATSKFIKNRPEVVQRVVAGLAEAVRFAEQDPVKTKAAIAKVMRLKDPEALEATYNTYTKETVDKRMVVPEKAVSEALERARRNGGTILRQPEDLYDNRFTAHLEQSGFMKQLWGLNWPAR